MNLLHIHWARIDGAAGPLVRERCRCGRVRAVLARVNRPLWWSAWHLTWADAVGEYRVSTHRDAHNMLRM